MFHASIYRGAPVQSRGSNSFLWSSNMPLSIGNTIRFIRQCIPLRIASPPTSDTYHERKSAQYIDRDAEEIWLRLRKPRFKTPVFITFWLVFVDRPTFAVKMINSKMTDKTTYSILIPRSHGLFRITTVYQDLAIKERGVFKRISIQPSTCALSKIETVDLNEGRRAIEGKVAAVKNKHHAAVGEIPKKKRCCADSKYTYLRRWEKENRAAQRRDPTVRKDEKAKATTYYGESMTAYQVRMFKESDVNDETKGFLDESDRNEKATLWQARNKKENCEWRPGDGSRARHCADRRAHQEDWKNTLYSRLVLVYVKR